MNITTLETDILILGSGGAGLFAALHAHQTNPNLHITIAVKGLLGKCGCTRMVQGGYNVALAEGDSVERHFMDTIEGGKWLSDQELAWTLVNKSVERIRELENELGCFFDRNPDGTVHQKAFAGQTFDRTVHKGDLTGIEIISRLAEQVWARGIHRLEEHRAVELIHSADGKSLAGVLMLDMTTGQFTLVRAKAVLLATGGGPTMYKYHTPSGDKSCDGLAMALRAGLTLRDMEMVQFHPTGLLAGPGTRMTGTVLEEGLRGAGGYLLNGNKERFMGNYDPRNERATRDIVSRSINSEIRAGRSTPNGGVYIQMSHLGPDNVRKLFKGMVERCADSGFDLAGDLVEVVPTAHYMMGGLIFKADCSTELPGLFAAGEDTGGVHGANRLGGNGVANSTVFGGIAGEEMANWVVSQSLQECNMEEVLASIKAHEAPLERPAGDIESIRDALAECMWDDVGISRTRESLLRARVKLDQLDQQLHQIGVGDIQREYSITWQDWMNLSNLILVSKSVADAALARENSRGAHYREDFPQPGSLEESYFTAVHLGIEGLEIKNRPVQFTMVKPGETILVEA
ncbi:Succinate dehydrogenase/fumarate reductase, flavoprotein subunit [Polynucleobacter duraquae]|uniref:Succinate dehydrogenase/fumarate reductase, flavoprotein subunit n=1 Tax=Polynucleobacter duraquae TaxID=1835254 RepID=A0A0E3V125_9BURK|nr:FAD-binding protein [Polynucleobacter duraquae]AKD25779.1 Succinate dehydrogenase/fumarate reductase, flavoprotein subunit [Polynucleobacter duraquae]